MRFHILLPGVFVRGVVAAVPGVVEVVAVGVVARVRIIYPDTRRGPLVGVSALRVPARLLGRRRRHLSLVRLLISGLLVMLQGLLMMGSRPLVARLLSVIVVHLGRLQGLSTPGVGLRLRLRLRLWCVAGLIGSALTYVASTFTRVFPPLSLVGSGEIYPL